MAPSDTPMSRPLTLFADDHLGHWTLKTIQDIQQMEAFMLKVFRLLASCGLKVNPETSSMVIRVRVENFQNLLKVARS